jgi:hypothetical protein
MVNHTKVSVEYISNTPAAITGNVKIELWIDEDEDGVYSVYDPNGGYTYSLNKLDTLEIILPYGNAVKHYRLLFVNQTSTVTGAGFTVHTHR